MKGIPLVQSTDRQLNQAHSQVTQGIRQMNQQAQQTLEAQAEMGSKLGALSDLLAGLSATGIGNGRLVQNIAIADTDREIAHGLGRPVRGWIVTRMNRWCTPWEQTPSPTPSITIFLRAAYSGTVDIYFF